VKTQAQKLKMITPEEDVKAEPSPVQEREDISIDGPPDEVEVDSSISETEEVKAEVQEVQAEVEQSKPQRVPLTRLKKEIQKRKELEAQIENLASTNSTNTHDPVAQAANTTKTQSVLKRPTLEESEYNEQAHETALAKYELDVRAQWKSELKEELKQESLQAQNQERVQKYQKSVNDLYDTDDVYAQAVNDIIENEGGTLEYSNMVQEAIASVGTEKESLDVDRYITINRAEIMPRLEGMTPMQQAMEIGRIAASIKVTQEPKAPKVKISQAPEPIDASQGSATFIDEDSARRKSDPTFSIE
jgi:hypothetical protein